MDMPEVTLSSKYQVVIPKAARKKLKLGRAAGQRFEVARVTEHEIVFRKTKSLDEYLGAYDHAFPKQAGAQLRRMRDKEWDD